MSSHEEIVLGAGCFWCLDATYKLIKGISRVEEGYSGGDVANPTDDQIYGGQTGHAEVVKLAFDPKVIGLDDILDIFFAIHDPTSLNHQDFDEGPQYRSAIYYTSEEQRPIIEAAVKRAQKLWGNKIVTEVKQLSNFYPASDYHNNYETNRPDYCEYIINPKLAKVRSKFSQFLKTD